MPLWFSHTPQLRHLMAGKGCVLSFCAAGNADQVARISGLSERLTYTMPGCSLRKVGESLTSNTPAAPS
jgi:hypothetical protein